MGKKVKWHASGMRGAGSRFPTQVDIWNLGELLCDAESCHVLEVQPDLKLA